MPGDIHYDAADGIATLTLSNPGKLNAIKAVICSPFSRPGTAPSAWAPFSRSGHHVSKGAEVCGKVVPLSKNKRFLIYFDP